MMVLDDLSWVMVVVVGELFTRVVMVGVGSGGGGSLVVLPI